ncbi:MAG: helix-turn-helix transcriptional regulator [Planctomycetes bacterium]|nr:helix-turn-helix transcriptional regulator [Planctomycetota bacterium]
MSVENSLKPRRQVMEALAALDREREDGLRLSNGGGGHDNGDDSDDFGGDDDDDDDDDMAERALDCVQTAYKKLRKKLDRLSEGELKFSGHILICKDGTLICEDYELLGEDHEDESEADELIEQLAEHLDESGQSVAEVARKIGRSAGALYSWLSQRTEPSASSCERIEAFLESCE